MRKGDWSLVLFTTLSQTSIGTVLCLVVLSFTGLNPGTAFGTGTGPGNPVLLSLVLVAVATTISLMHLGNPLNAPKALSNLSGSWLSREILALGLYALCLSALFLTGWIAENNNCWAYLLTATGVLGLIFLWMMIRIYTVPTIPTWNNWHTPASFVLTTVSLGLAVTLVLSGTGYAKLAPGVIQKLSAILAAVLLVECVTAYINQQRLAFIETGIDKLDFTGGRYHGLFVGRMWILACAISTAIFMSAGPGDTMSGLVALLLILAATQETLGRILFYSSYFRVGV